MVRLATKADDGHIRALLAVCPCNGAVMGVNWRLLQHNPAVPYRFYLVGEAAVLELSAAGASLCGTPQDEAELMAFLSAEGVPQLASEGFAPKGWQAHRLCKMLLQPGAGAAGAQENPPKGLDALPPAGEVMALLENARPMGSAPQRELFYFNLCMRRNHGYAEAAGIRQNGALVCTAGVYAQTENEAYIAAVETLPTWQGRGYAGALIRWLCQSRPLLRKTLVCAEEMRPFYQKLGFVEHPQPLVIYERPKEEMPPK